MRRYFWPALLLFISGAFIAEEMRAGQLDRAFRDRGKVATILPVTNFIAREVREGGIRFNRQRKLKGHAYSAELRYHTHEGLLVTTAPVTMPPDIYLAAKKGAPVEIEYLPDEPTTVRLRQQHREQGAMIPLYVLFAIGLFWMYHVSRKPTEEMA